MPLVLPHMVDCCTGLRTGRISLFVPLQKCTRLLQGRPILFLPGKSNTNSLLCTAGYFTLQQKKCAERRAANRNTVTIVSFRTKMCGTFRTSVSIIPCTNQPVEHVGSQIPLLFWEGYLLLTKIGIATAILCGPSSDSTGISAHFSTGAQVPGNDFRTFLQNQLPCSTLPVRRRATLRKIRDTIKKICTTLVHWYQFSTVNVSRRRVLSLV